MRSLGRAIVALAVGWMGLALASSLLLRTIPGALALGAVAAVTAWLWPHRHGGNRRRWR